jgi:transposase
MKTAAELEEIVTQKDAEIAELEALVKYYEEQFRLAKHRQFGVSSEKSEYDFGQLSIFNEAELFADEKAAEPELVEVETHYRKRTRLTTDKLPEDLPVEVIEHELTEAERVCPDCCGVMHRMGRETRRELVIIPAQVKLREHIRHVYACRNCENTGIATPIVKAEMPEPVIKGSFASPEAIAHIMTQKFVMGVPLYRQEQEFLRQDILLSRQTMSNWLIRASEVWLEPVYDDLKRELLSRDVLHADETTLQVLHEPGKTAQSKSYMWLYRTGGDAEHPIVLYEYQPDRKSSRPAEFLGNFKGYLHADGYDGYHKLPESITVVGCWAHLRRKFDEALKVLPERDREGSLALRGKRYCDKLFEFERGFAELSAEARLQARLERAKPVMDEFFTWAQSCGAAPKTPVGKAAYYALSQRKYLENYLLDGRLELSNNRAERSIKPFVIGRKNWLFANTPRGAKASAVIYSLIETAKERGLSPFEYLTFLFDTLPNAAVKTGKA